MGDPGELAQFLRSRRERLSPEEVGLPSAGRRRTPGLRREELATLANVSIDYLVRLEQGRDTNPSAAVLSALAEALRLSDDDRRHLTILAMKTNNVELCPAPRPLVSQVRPTLVALLHSLNPTPAFILNPVYDLLAWNQAWERLTASLGVTEGDPPNLVRYVFLNPMGRQALPDWHIAADNLAAGLRAAGTRWGSDPRFEDLVRELRSAPDFLERWEAHVTERVGAQTLRIAHPDAGILRIGVEVLLAQEAEQRVVSWLPGDEATQSAMSSLLSTPLHVVREA